LSKNEKIQITSGGGLFLTHTVLWTWLSTRHFSWHFSFPSKFKSYLPVCRLLIIKRIRFRCYSTTA